MKETVDCQRGKRKEKKKKIVKVRSSSRLPAKPLRDPSRPQTTRLRSLDAVLLRRQSDQESFDEVEKAAEDGEVTEAVDVVDEVESVPADAASRHTA
jgi:hypothetical protein